MAAIHYCAECRNGEIYDEEAVIKVRFIRDGRPITEWVCEPHLTMLEDDHGAGLREVAIHTKRKAPNENTKPTLC